jgi:5-formyltetrahydrofolate cyclo-ligase
MPIGPADDEVDLRPAKQALRRQILGERAALSAPERERLSGLITAPLLHLPELQRARCVLAYLSFGHEFSTAGLLASLRERQVAVVMPRIDRAAHRLDLYRVHDISVDTTPGVWGIREPDPQRCTPAQANEIDLIVVPGVAFTRAGARLGYGGGYYDELLSRWQDPPLLIAPAFDLQIVAELPTTARDRPVDVVVTETAVYSA